MMHNSGAVGAESDRGNGTLMPSQGYTNLRAGFGIPDSQVV